MQLLHRVQKARWSLTLSIFKIINRLTLKDSGKFIGNDGLVIPW